jgi:hypothetical protein
MRALLTLVLGLVLVATTAPTASAAPAPREDKSDFATAPGYEASRLRVTGTNKPIDQSYTLTVYVAKRSVFRTCPSSMGDMRTNLINNPDAVSGIASDMNIGYGGPFAKTITYQTGGVRKLTYCAYVRWIIDDVAVSGLHATLRPRSR